MMFSATEENKAKQGREGGAELLFWRGCLGKDFTIMELV